ncbi:hypothetical protein ACMU_06535 [Actibacterium mucosum KCTC 23349]|uniref:Medium/long-chain acyl-CoA thioesterase YigI n=1 Tax=Actibacterium mucosum KCTC 23349 TaxID=1454373 RepID=A0A037ZP44_9RHOB|nr:PaaI family thioesterase [Actibacterium mucosum]KAJ56596.1 hypothetical protein ACMU_06535 [Actibacterium mucosum KCTC 23349]
MTFKTHGDYATRARASFARQAMMTTLGAQIADVAPGQVRLTLPFNPDLTQQHGFMHAGAITSVLDTAAGFAAYTLMPEDAAVLTVELKSSLLRPAAGVRFHITGQVVKPGRTIIFTEATAMAEDGQGVHTEIARLSASMMVVQGRAFRG